MLAFRELNDPCENRSGPTRRAYVTRWLKTDVNSKAIFWHFLGEEHLDHVRVIISADNVWLAFNNIFQRRTLFNRLNAKQKFNSLKPPNNERLTTYINRGHQLCANLNAVDEMVTYQEFSMSALSEIPSK